MCRQYMYKFEHRRTEPDASCQTFKEFRVNIATVSEASSKPALRSVRPDNSLGLRTFRVGDKCSLRGFGWPFTSAVVFRCCKVCIFIPPLLFPRVAPVLLCEHSRTRAYIYT